MKKVKRLFSFSRRPQRFSGELIQFPQVDIEIESQLLAGKKISPVSIQASSSTSSIDSAAKTTLTLESETTRASFEELGSETETNKNSAEATSVTDSSFGDLADAS
eukprot:TRINITY_DN9575_c0_g1_i3.p1 TRINITY_DN9575_c0_g1~~TRINITY_DN9575_c0_g1_i3.p1  ORF type:complete len:106 (+),score=8.98 TRINITY_DN9575_c0_g1_i3:57-374(+)